MSSFKSLDFSSEDIFSAMNTGLAGSLRNMAAAFAQARKELSLSGADQFKRNRINAEAWEAARSDLVSLVAQERGLVEKEMDDLRKAYVRDSELYVDKYQAQARSYERRINALSGKELEQECHDVMSGNKQLRPDEVDILSSALKESDPAIFTMLRDEVKSSDLYSPWKHTPDGIVITKYLETLSAAEKHGGEVPVRGENGKSYNVMLDSIIGRLDGDE